MSETKKIFHIIKRDLFSKTGSQTFTLFSSQIIALALGILSGIINTRTLGSEGFGVLTFFFTFTGFTVLFFRFGLASSVALLLAETKEKEKERELLGASVFLAFFVGVIYSLSIFISSFFVDNLFHTNVGWIFRYASVLLVSLPFTFFIPMIGKGTNQIGWLSVFNIIPKVIYILGALVLLNFIQIEPFYFILLDISSTLISVVLSISVLHLTVSHFKENLLLILNKTKEYGFNMYLSQIADQSTYKLDGILITLFVNTTQLGFYSLAMTLTSPLVLLSQASSTCLFKDFVHQDRIPQKVIMYNFAWSILCVLGLVILGPFLIVVLFGEEFLPAKGLILPLALAGFFQAMYQPYNMFLGAKRKGEWMRNMSVTMAMINLLGNISLIPSFGAMGAAIASLCGTGSFFIMTLYYYNRLLK